MPIYLKRGAGFASKLGVLKRRNSYFLIITLAMVLIISVVNPEFFTLENLRDFLRSISVSGILALGAFIVILSGGVDISFAAVATFSMYFSGYYMARAGGNIFVALLVSCLIGIGLGSINGLLVGKLGIPTIIATLGMLSILRSGLVLITKGRWIYMLPDYFIGFSKSSILSIPVQSIFYIVLLLITSFIMRYSIVGRGIYAMGGDRESAAQVGYPIFRLQMFIYSYVGMLAGVAGFLNISVVRLVDPRSFINVEFPVIAAVVLGGASIQGGVGSVTGTLLGSVFVTIMNRGLVFLKVSSLWHNIVIGLIILLSVSINAIRKNRMEETAIRIAVD